MSDLRCPRCGTDIAHAGPLAGLCPVCLLATAAASSPVERSSGAARDPIVTQASSPAFAAEGPGWQCVALIAETEWGRTYLGRARDESGPLVIRVANPGRLARGDAEALVERQRAIAAAPVHPVIAGVRDAGLMADGRPFVVRSYVAGQPLHDFRRSHAPAAAVGANLLSCVREALEALHARGIVHGHLVAANVLVSTAAGRATPTLTDAAVHGAAADDASAQRAELVDLARLAGDRSRDA